jgi:hypothetical protein
MSRNLKEVSAKSYISTDSYNDNFFTYSVTTGPSPQFKKTGALTSVSGATSLNCPAGRILRENGKKLFPDAYPGVQTYMVGVFDILNNLSGFINPNDPVFAPFNGDRPNYLKDSVNSQAKNLGAPVLTQGAVMCSGEIVSSGQVRSQEFTLLEITNFPFTSYLDVSLGQVFMINLGKNVTLIPINMSVGAHVYLIVQCTLNSTLSFGTGVFGLGPLVVEKDKYYTIHFICNSSSYMFELGRTPAFTQMSP